MKRERVHYFNMGPWPYHVGFTTCAEAFAREMRRLKIDNANGHLNKGANATTHHLVKDGGASIAIISMEPPRRGVSRECYASMLAHEAVHVVQEMRDQLGDLGREAEAYIVQRIVLQGLQIAWKTGRIPVHVPLA